MRFFSRKRLFRALAVWTTIAIVLTVLTVRERRRVLATATTPNASAPQGPLDGRALIADVERLASPAFAGRRTGTPGSRAAQDFIVERFRALNIQPTFDSYRQPFSFTRRSIKGFFSPFRPYRTEYPEAANIGGVIRGTMQPPRFLALTAHYDSFGVQDGQLFPGADDNATGVAVMLGAAGVLSKEPLRHSLLLLALDAEELGIRGAAHYVKHAPVDLRLIDGVLNMDMVGRGDDNTLVAAGVTQHPEFEAPVRAAAANRRLRVIFGHDRPMYKAGLVANWVRSSDHGPFHDAGVPFIYLGVEDHEDYHRPTDTADRIPPAFLGEVGNLVVSLLRELDR